MTLSPRLLRTEALAGLVVAFSLIPEVISFSVILGVDPAVGLFTSVVMTMTIAVVGGRPAMVTAAAGATALVMAPLVQAHGVHYLVAAVLLAGVLQIVLGLMKVGRLMRFIPPAAMSGFLTGLAILIALAQWDNLYDVPWPVYPLAVLGISIIVLTPRVTRVVPAPLVAIAVLTAMVWIGGIGVPTVADHGALLDSIPPFGLPDVPWTWETLMIIAPYAIAMALVGLMESLMTAVVVDDLTKTGSDKNRESWGLGIANLASGLFGGQGGCAMIGQSVIGVRQGGARTRLSTFLAGLFLLVLLLVGGEVVGQIPMVALAAVMLVVAAMTVDWRMLGAVPRLPRSESATLLVTVALVVSTENLAIGIIAGSVLYAIGARLRPTRVPDSVEQRADQVVQ